LQIFLLYFIKCKKRITRSKR